MFLTETAWAWPHDTTGKGHVQFTGKESSNLSMSSQGLSAEKTMQASGLSFWWKTLQKINPPKESGNSMLLLLKVRFDFPIPVEKSFAPGISGISAEIIFIGNLLKKIGGDNQSDGEKAANLWCLLPDSGNLGSNLAQEQKLQSVCFSGYLATCWKNLVLIWCETKNASDIPVSSTQSWFLSLAN